VRTFLIPLLIVLGSCSAVDEWRNPEVAACENFIKEGLASPSSYHRIKFLTDDEEISAEDYAYGKGWTPNSPFFDLAIKEAVDPAIRSASIEYDAANGYGTPIRSFGFCQFLMSNAGQDEFGEDPAKAAESIRSMNAVAALAPGLTEQQRVLRPCCLKPSLQARRKAAE